MMEPSLALQIAIVAALKNNTDAKANVFDRVTPGVFPRIAIGSGQTIQDGADCIHGFEVYFQIDVYSNADGWVQCKTIASQVHGLLHRRALRSPGYSLTDANVESAVFSREDNEQISRARMVVKAYLEAS